jgi:hypothetical protein
MWESRAFLFWGQIKGGEWELPEQWRWSGYRHYLLGEAGLVQVNVGWGEISFRGRVA